MVLHILIKKFMYRHLAANF